MNSALLVVDVQRALVDYLPADRKRELLKVVGGLIARARAAGVPVVYVQHSDEELVYGSSGWEIASEIAPMPGDARIYKTLRDAFRETGLEETLSRLGATHVVVCGMQSEYCVDSTLREAERRGYEVTLASDAHATYDSPDLSEAQIASNVNRVAAGLAKTIAPASSLFV